MYKYIVLVLMLACIVGCGKRGDPVPRDQKNIFQLQKIEARMVNASCLNIVVLLSGATKNVQSFSLELEPLTIQADPNLPPELQQIQESCEGCPFTPREVANLSADNGQDGLYNFTYCPKSLAASYRLRVVVKNVFLSFPYVLSPIQTVSTTK